MIFGLIIGFIGGFLLCAYLANQLHDEDDIDGD